jgi:hypothetical protein
MSNSFLSLSEWTVKPSVTDTHGPCLSICDDLIGTAQYGKSIREKQAAAANTAAAE